jgi:hypothetical protein
MSNQSLSPDPIPTHQPGGMPRVPGNRTPRRVQWASAVDSAVDKDGVAGRRHENGLESDADSTHELDEAALDVRATPVSHTLLRIHPCFHSQLRSKHLPTLLNVTVRAPHPHHLSLPLRSIPDCLHLRL